MLSVQRLTKLLSLLGANVVVKRASLLTIDDLRNHNVIFLGSPFENRFLAEIHLRQRFTFEGPKAIPYLWRGRIADTMAGASGNRFYELERDPHTHVIIADYALFEVLPGIAPERRIVILAGLTTSGTEGASEFATSEAGLRQISEKLGGKNGGRKALPGKFECLLRVDLVNGLDVLHVDVAKVAADR